VKGQQAGRQVGVYLEGAARFIGHLELHVDAPQAVLDRRLAPALYTFHPPRLLRDARQAVTRVLSTPAPGDMRASGDQKNRQGRGDENTRRPPFE